jgi:hypothetical protein
MLFDPGLAGLADSNDTNDGGDSDGNAENRQEAAQLIAQQGNHR